jgi:hypothetical protein
MDKVKKTSNPDGVHTKLRIYWLVQQLLASQQELSSIELIG